MGAKNLYSKDFFAWTQANIGFLKNNEFTSVDITNIILELEDMGLSNKNALENYLIHLMSHRLKWTAQPNWQCNSWNATITQAGLRIKKILKKNPSLKNFAEMAVADCYEEAVLEAIKDTGLEQSFFPPECPFTLTKLLD
jgi:hypothetical protein